MAELTETLQNWFCPACKTQNIGMSCINCATPAPPQKVYGIYCWRCGCVIRETTETVVPRTNTCSVCKSEFSAAMPEPTTTATPEMEWEATSYETPSGDYRIYQAWEGQWVAHCLLNYWVSIADTYFPTPDAAKEACARHRAEQLRKGG